jgi:hypothetical protein
MTKSMLTSILTVLMVATLSGGQDLNLPPTIPGGKTVVTDTSRELLKPTETLKPGVKIAKAPPSVEFMYYDVQKYKTKLWSAWGDSLAIGDKCYSSIGDHDAPEGNAFLYEYDSKTKKLKMLVDLREVLKMPKGHYTPGKIHSRIDLGSDGWLYFSTHRGSTKVAFNPQHQFKGDWIIRHHPTAHKTEIVAHAPLPLQCMPTSVLDPDRLIFYVGTADGLNKKKPAFLAYDLKKHKVLYDDAYGPYRYAIFARSTGRLYFHGNSSSPNRTQGPARLSRFNPDKPAAPVEIKATVGLRAATMETSTGMAYTIDKDNLWSFNTKTEKAVHLGPSAVGSKDYTTSIDIDRNTNRYLYYVPGAHGGADIDGSPLVQYDLKTRTRKVIAFLHPYYFNKYRFVPCGAFGTAVSPQGDKVYITWNGNASTKPQDINKRIKFNICAFMVVHIPESERQQ